MNNEPKHPTPNGRDLFLAALELAPEARAAFLNSACAGNTALRAEVDSLLEHHAADSFLESPAPGLDETVALPATPLAEGPGTRIGRYKLLQRIGEGGMGVVYMAEQEEPVRRQVALKIIKLGMDTRQVVARFEAERQALAMMDHPHIAKVLDAGATDSGRPFFVMELVRGVPITEYCDKNHLPARRRLELFITVCQAIQHAHQKGVIHRDIKPSNVLVTLNDSVPHPMVIDFGIAKATHQKLTEKTLFTHFAQMVGTPAYMSPEQAEMSKLDVDTRSDIYSLGVLLYELLTGTTPFPAKELLSLGYGEMQRVIAESEPPRPSTRLSTMQNAQRTVVAKNLGQEAAALERLFKGDLDWIVMKCLEKDRTRRYDTANGLAGDVRRHLENEPVAARPPSQLYRFQKMARRNRLAIAAGAVVSITLISALAFSTAALVRERQARETAKVAERATQTESIRADSVANFVTHFIDSVVPDLHLKGHSESIKRLLNVADRLALELTNAPLAANRIQFAVAIGYSDYLLDDRFAFPKFKAVQERASSLGQAGDSLAELSRIRALGSAMWNEMDEKYAVELAQYGESALKRSPADYFGACFGLGASAEFFLEADLPEEAERLVREAVRVSSLHPEVNEFRLPQLNILVQLASKRGAVAEAERAADELFATLGKIRATETNTDRRRSLRELNNIFVNDWSHIPAASVGRALETLQPEDRATRTMLRGFLGVAMARGGDWRGGLKVLEAVAIDPTSSVNFWIAGIQLSALLGQADQQRTLAMSGLAGFASGANGSVSCMLMQQLLFLPPDPSLLPTLTNLAIRAHDVPAIMNWGNRLVQSFFSYRTEQFPAALNWVGEGQDKGRSVLSRSKDQVGAQRWFLRSSILMRMGRVAEAQEAYRKGIRFQPANAIQAGTPYQGDRWWEACTAELLRREAASLLDTAVPTSP